MSRERTAVVGVATMYVAVSLAAGVAAFAGARVAHTRFLRAATGDGAEELGPVFVESIVTQLGLTALIVAPVLAALAGLLITRGVVVPLRAIGTGVIMGLCGTLLFGAAVAVLGSAGAPVGSLRTQSFLLVIAVVAGVSAVVSGVSAAVGAMTG